MTIFAGFAPYFEAPTPSPDGTNKVFELTYAPATYGLALFNNGLYQYPPQTYTIFGKTITFTTAPEADDELFAHYIF